MTVIPFLIFVVVETRVGQCNSDIFNTRWQHHLFIKNIFDALAVDLRIKCKQFTEETQRAK